MYITEEQLLGESLFDTNGRILLRKGIQLKKETIRSIEKLGYHSLYVYDQASDNVTEKTLFLDDALKLKALKIIRDNFYQFKIIYHMRSLGKDTKKLFKLMEDRDNLLQKLHTVTDEILLALKKLPSHQLDRVEIKSDLNYQYQHALHTAIIATIIGMHSNLNYLELKSIFIGSIMKEMGNVAIPEEILFKKGKLTAIEFDILKSHTEISYQEIRNCDDINNNIKQICLEHHEKLDGSGYPNGLLDQQISGLTKIVAIADTYDALTSDRSFRPAYPPHRALKMMSSEIGKAYDRTLLKTLKKLVVPFPIGTFINLNEGYGRVVQYTPDDERPIIELQNGSKVDLSHNPNYEITGLKYRI
jgi:HD-GYP domain-containing protein (c-di-GMP phosphodiesterase class II)